VKQILMNFTPFPYQLYLPVGIYLGKITGAKLVTGPGHAGRLGGHRLSAGAFRLASRHQKICRRRRMIS
jgi:hypothetical protein